LLEAGVTVQISYRKIQNMKENVLTKVGTYVMREAETKRRGEERSKRGKLREFSSMDGRNK